MLRSAKEIYGYRLLATDGTIGSCQDFLFDDRDWVVRYVVADTGRWLFRHRVLISPGTMGTPRWRERDIPVGMTKDEIETSPDLAEDAPVSVAYEKQWHEHHGLSPYWGGPRRAPTVMRNLLVKEVDERRSPHLRSTRELAGYHARATDGRIGHVRDFIVDDDVWTIRYLVVDTNDRLPGGKVLIAPAWVASVDWPDRCVDVRLTKAGLKGSPRYDPVAPVNRRHEIRLYDYHGSPRYWEE